MYMRSIQKMKKRPNYFGGRGGGGHVPLLTKLRKGVTNR